jgi:hypothetical protein
VNLPTGWAPESFPSLVTLSRPGAGSFRTGAPSRVPATVAQHLPCSIQPLDPADGANFFMAVEAQYDTLVYFPADPGARPDDRLADEKTGRVYQVRGRVNQADEDLLWSVSCRSVDATL